MRAAVGLRDVGAPEKKAGAAVLAMLVLALEAKAVHVRGKLP